MSQRPSSDQWTQRELLEHLSTLSDDTSCRVISLQGATADPPAWIPELFPGFSPHPAAFNVLSAESKHHALVAVAASRTNAHVVSAIQLDDEPHQLRQLHLVSFGADDPDGTGEAVIVIVTFADNNAVVYHDVAQIDPVASRWLQYTCNELGVLLSYDPAIETLLGWTATDLLGAALLDIIHPDDSQESVDRWLKAITSEQPVRGRVRQRTKTGEWKWFEVTNTNLLATEGYVRCDLLDITSEMEMFDELARQEELLRRLTEALPSGVVQFDRAGKLLFANHRLTEITGVLHGQLDDYLELFDPATQEDIQSMALTIYSDAIEVDMEATLYRADGLVRHTQLAFRPLLIDDKGAGGLLICVDDITESWNLRTALARQASTDGLTGVANRSSAHEALAEAIVDRRSNGSGVVYFDLNGFKAANDELGHGHGDAMLEALAFRLQASARSTDTVGRVGGDEFIVVVPDTNEKELALLAKRLLDAANAPAKNFILDAACGFTFVPASAVSATLDRSLDRDFPGRIAAERAIDEADSAMYWHKRNPGSSPVQFRESFLLSNEREAS